MGSVSSRVINDEGPLSRIEVPRKQGNDPANNNHWVGGRSGSTRQSGEK